VWHPLQAQDDGIFGDNMSVVTKSSKPESIMKKKSNSVCYHAVREAVVMREALAAHIGIAYNLADLFTKAMYGQALHSLVGRLMYDVIPYMDGIPTAASLECGEISLSCLTDRVSWVPCYWGFAFGQV
jgi:hypothetical protein